MEELLAVAAAGFLASVVDGALGMGFGPTSSAILLSTGVSASSASTMVNIAKVFTGLAGAVGHWRFGNVDRRLVLRLAGPGVIGAVTGALLLAVVDGDDLRPWLAGILVVIGLRILVRFASVLPPPSERTPATDTRGVEVAGAAGGLTNGLVGAWGPVVTPYLVHRGMAPNIVVGSVNTAEVVVAVAAVGSLLGAIGTGGIDVALVVAMLAGGIVAAPVAAFTVKRVPARMLGLGVAGLLLVTQLRELHRADVFAVPPLGSAALVAVAVAIAAARPRVRHRVHTRRAARAGS